MALELNIRAFIVDELEPIARISGFASFERQSIFHALKQNAVARKYAQQIGRKYEDLKLILTHMGGGITVGAHKYGIVIDVNNGLHRKGPFSPERTGTVPVKSLIKLCYSREFYWQEMMKKLVGKWGLFGYLGTNDAVKVVSQIK